MAWKYTLGKSLADVLSYSSGDIADMSTPELRETVRKMGSAANRRAKNLEKKKARTPALIDLEKGGGNIATKGKSREQVEAEYIRAKSFLEDDTSTTRGWKKWIKEFKELTRVNAPGEDEGEEFNRVVARLMAEFRSRHNVEAAGGSAVVRDTVIEVITDNPSKDFYDLMREIESRLVEDTVDSDVEIGEGDEFHDDWEWIL